MKNTALQDTPTFETLAPEEVFKRVIKFEHNKLTTMAFQKVKLATAAGTSTSHKSGVKIKQEPVMTLRISNGSTRKQPIKSKNIKRPKKKLDPLLPVDKQNPAIDLDVYLIRDIWHLVQRWGKSAKTAVNLAVLRECAYYSKWVKLWRIRQIGRGMWPYRGRLWIIKWSEIMSEGDKITFIRRWKNLKSCGAENPWEKPDNVGREGERSKDWPT